MSNKLRQFFTENISRVIVERAIGVLLLVLALYFFREHISIFFLVFIFSYLFWEGGAYIAKALEKRKIKISEKIVIILLYLVFILFIGLALNSVIPKAISEIKQINYTELINNSNIMVNNMLQPFWVNIDLEAKLKEYMSQMNFLSLGEDIKGIGRNITSIFVALIFSFIFLMEKDTIKTLIAPIKDSIFSNIYLTYSYLGAKFTFWVGAVFKAQFVTALIDATLVPFGLVVFWYAMQGSMFPFASTIAIILFIFWFVPVLGIMFSSIPIFFISYHFGGVDFVILAAILIFSMQALETYYITPRMLWKYTEFPVFVVLIILYISQNIMGVAGLIVWVPMVIVIVSLLTDLNKKYIQNENTE